MSNDSDVFEPCDGSKFIGNLVLQVRETTDEFIFQTILPFCEERMERSISKRVLIDALTEYFAKHGTEEELNAEQSQ